MDENGQNPRRWKDEKGINVIVEFEPAICIDLEFGPVITDIGIEVSERVGLVDRAELMDAEGERATFDAVNARENRVKKAAHLYFYDRKTLQEIARVLKISKSQAHNDIQSFKMSVSDQLRKDIRANKYTLGLFTKILMAVEGRHKRYLAQLEELEDIHGNLRRDLRMVRRRYRGTSHEAEIDRDVVGISQEMRANLASQRNVLAQMRAETAQELDLYQAYGLCGPEAQDLVSGGMEEIRKKKEEAGEFLKKMVDIIRVEVKDSQAQKVIFERLAKEIKHSCEHGWMREESSGWEAVDDTGL